MEVTDTFCLPKPFDCAISSSLAAQMVTSIPVALTLPPEIWGKVFSFMPLKMQVAAGKSYVKDANLFRIQKEFQRLRLVCRNFNSIFRAQPELSRSVFLHQYFAAKKLNSFLAWTQHHAASVETLVAECPNPQLNVVLTGLLQERAPLRAVTCSELSCGGHTLHLLASFSALQNCKLSGPSDAHSLDLSPLGTLQSLQHLQLTGHSLVSTHQLPPALRTLSLETCAFELYLEDQRLSCLKTLEVLDVTDSSSLYILPAGLPALSGLQSLTCKRSFINTPASRTDPFMMLDDGAFQVPCTLSSFTCLSKLCIEYTGPTKGPLDFGNIYSVATLQHLSISCDRHVAIDHSLTALQQLTALTLSVKAVDGLAEEKFGKPDIQDVPELSLDVNWAALPHFQRMTIEADIFKCQCNFRQLLEVSSLEFIEIQQNRPSDAHTSTHYTTLVYYLGVHRPDVCINLDTKRISG